MKLCLWIAALLLVVVGTNADFNLYDALDPDPTNPPKVTEKPKPKSNDPEPEKPKKPTSGGGGDGGFDLGDALGPDPDPKPTVPPKTGGGGGGGGGGGFDDSDLWDDSKGELKPEGGAGDQDPYNDGGADQPQGREKTTPPPPPPSRILELHEAGAGQIAGIASAVGMAILGAASSYIAYQKKKLCFKIQGGTDPESGKNYEGNRGQPRQNAGGNPLSVLTNLLRTS